jgi:2-(1,2-epoxy-1,2-dihydrophenyl)acetyl-CoA isomerase
MSRQDSILSRIEDGIQIITLNRPEVMNAIDSEVSGRLDEILQVAALDPDARVVVITGAGRGFCAGGNMKNLGNPDESDPLAAKWGRDPIWNGMDMRSARLRRSALTPYLLHTMGKPTIAMIHGPVVGAGMSLALACDFRLASPDATFNSGYLNRGLSGDFGANYFITSVLGPAKAREFLFFPRAVAADEAQRMGLITRMAPEGKLEEETMAMARKLADGPPIALGHLKENINSAANDVPQVAFDIEARNFVRCLQTEDCKEAVASFLERRKAVFKGR